MSFVAVVHIYLALVTAGCTTEFSSRGSENSVSAQRRAAANTSDRLRTVEVDKCVPSNRRYDAFGLLCKVGANR